MQVINWLELQPLPADLEVLKGHLHQVLPLRQVYHLLVETTLRAYPWMGRADLISCYHPSQTYKQDQKIALPISDSQNVRPVVWLVAQVRHTRAAENPIQGRFQVLTLDFQGRQLQMAADILNASYLEPNLSNYTSEDLAWLVEWISDKYATTLQATLQKLLQTGQICGQLAGEIFLPEHVSAISLELLHPVFARLSPTRPWIGLEEILKDLPDLSPLKRETVLALLPGALKDSPYRFLGAGRWTTPELFHRLNREVPLGLPTPQIHSDMSIWTKQDEKDLAGYHEKFMPMETRQALEELGVVEGLPEQNESPWRAPKGPVRLPTLNYLHITQAYFPAGSFLHAFAPDVQMVFVQFIHGDHQPFLLDRENSLLKAVHPQELSTQILKEGIPAGTYLWLEYEGNDQYRIVPRTLPFKRMVPCKLAHLVDRHLHIEHTQISMIYESDPSLFKADLRFEEIKALFAEAGNANLRVRDAMIYAIQELCATDPDHRAHRMDIFNTVFLQRLCSPRSVSLLLYTQPCFEQLGGAYFRYKSMPEPPARNRPKRKDRLSKLWEGLLSDRVLPDPVTEEAMSVEGGLESRYPAFPAFPSDLERPPHLREPETEPAFSVLALPLVAVEENRAAQTTLKEETRIEALLLGDDEPDPSSATDTAEPVRHSWQDSLGSLLNNLEELVNQEPSILPTEEVTSEQEAFSDMPMEATHEESLSFSSPFRWEPKPAWLDPPSRPNHPLPNTSATRPLVYISKIPNRPLHKQPLYRRLYFYLRGWLSRKFRKTV